MGFETSYVFLIYVYIYWVYHSSTARLQERTPHIERGKKVYDNMGLEMHIIGEW